MRKRMTMVQAFSGCAKKLKTSALTESAMEKTKNETSLMRRVFGVSPIQGCLLSLIMSGKNVSITTDEMAKYLGMNVVDVIGLHQELEAMANRGIITIEEERPFREWNERYNPTMRMLLAIRRNSGIESEDYTKYNESRFWSETSRIMAARRDDKIVYGEFRQGVMEMVEGCSNVEVCGKISGMQLREEEVIFLLFAMLRTKRNMPQIFEYEVDGVFPKQVRKEILQDIQTGVGGLVEKNIMESVCDEAGYSCRMTDEAQKELMGIVHKGETTKIHHDEEVEEGWKAKDVKIKAKEMFYNASEEGQIERLREMLGIKSYKEIVRRMEAEGMNAGLTCLLYGMPGTGKTETVKQIALETGRKIIQVDMSSLKSKWCGETEKNVNQVFEDYRTALEEHDIEPILLFNEADAIFSKRCKSVSDNNVQHSNSVQNILLENMETFRGILIATTNLTDNFDKAFERRFLYKIRFSKPDATVRAKIWKSKIPSLREEEVNQLSERYELSGAQIDNVARKILIEKILYGEMIDCDRISRLCIEERGEDKRNSNLKI